jgi:hypothetical protein
MEGMAFSALSPRGRSRVPAVLLAVLSAAALLSVACDDGTTDAPGSPAGGAQTFTAADVPTYEAFLARVYPTVCQVFAPCCTSLGQAVRADCAAYAEAADGKETDAPAGATFYPESAARCLNAIAAGTCGAGQLGDASCDDLFRTPNYQKLGAGEACIVDSDCLVPAGQTGTCSGTCSGPWTPDPNAAPACAEPGEVLEPGTPELTCSAEEKCVSGACQPLPTGKKGLGASCETSADCDSGSCAGSPLRCGDDSFREFCQP